MGVESFRSLALLSIQASALSQLDSPRDIGIAERSGTSPVLSITPSCHLEDGKGSRWDYFLYRIVL